MKPQQSIQHGDPKVQLLEQRSIAVYTAEEGVKSLPFQPIDTSIYSKTADEIKSVKEQKAIYKGVSPIASAERERDVKRQQHNSFKRK